MVQEDKKQIPVPPLPPKTNLTKGIQFWSQILLILDKKMQMMEETLGYGEVGVTFKYHRGKLTQVRWNDEVSDVVLLEKGNGFSHELAEETKPK